MWGREIWELLFCMPTPEIYEKNWPSKSSFFKISLHKCPLLTSGIDPAWSKYPPGSILEFFWLFKKFILAIFNFLTNFWPSKSSIFLVYSHSRGVSHHFQPSLSSLPIGISHMSLRPTYNLPWTPLIRVSSAHIRASVTEEGLSLTSIFISPGLGLCVKNRDSGAVFQFWEIILRIEKRTIPGPLVWFLRRANAD